MFENTAALGGHDERRATLARQVQHPGGIDFGVEIDDAIRRQRCTVETPVARGHHREPAPGAQVGEQRTQDSQRLRGETGRQIGRGPSAAGDVLVYQDR